MQLEWACTTIGGSSYRLRPTPGSWFGFLLQANQAFYSSELDVWEETNAVLSSGVSPLVIVG